MQTYKCCTYLFILTFPGIYHIASLPGLFISFSDKQTLYRTVSFLDL